jgi:hypothetical protein
LPLLLLGLSKFLCLFQVEFGNKEQNYQIYLTPSDINKIAIAVNIKGLIILSPLLRVRWLPR